MKLTGYKLAFMVNGRDRVEVTLHADTVKERIIEDVRDQLRDACYRDAELLYFSNIIDDEDEDETEGEA